MSRLGKAAMKSDAADVKVVTKFVVFHIVVEIRRREIRKVRRLNDTSVMSSVCCQLNGATVCIGLLNGTTGHNTQYCVAFYPGPPFNFARERPAVCENTSCDITLSQRGCVHGDASFHHGIVPECLWPVCCKYSSSETKLASSTIVLARHYQRVTCH